jgi:hypothetical protein
MTMFYAGRVYPKKGLPMRRYFWHRSSRQGGFFAFMRIRINGRHYPEPPGHHWSGKRWAARRKRDKRVNWLALVGTKSLNKKRDAMRKAGEVPPRGWIPYSVRR